MTNWGGARQGAGRPSYMLTENKIMKWEREIRKRAKEEGKTLIGTLLDIAYAKVDEIGAKISVRDRIAAVEAIWKFTTPKSSEHNINVNAIAPGYMETDNTAPLRNDPVRNKAILERIPAGRWGKPDDLKGVIVFLASDASSYLHGFTIAVDGGWLAR